MQKNTCGKFVFVRKNVKPFHFTFQKLWTFFQLNFYLLKLRIVFKYIVDFARIMKHEAAFTICRKTDKDCRLLKTIAK